MKQLYATLAWYLRRRWMIRRIICNQTLDSNMKFLKNLITTGMIKSGSNQYYDFIHMMRVHSK